MMVLDAAQIYVASPLPVPMHKYIQYRYGGLLGMVEFTLHHSLQFRDR